MYDATPIEPDYSSGFGPQTPGTQPGIHADSLWRVLDEINEIDDGLILVDGNGLIQHANHLARHELARGQFLCLVQTGDQARAAAHGAPQGQLQALDQLPEEVNAQLLRGIQGATQGLRQMLTLRRDGESLPVACVPLFQRFEGQAASVLVMLGRQSATPNLALTFFAREHSLSQAEECLLRGLCKGQKIPDIAVAHGVAESTIRTQIRSLREKTQCHSIRLLVQQVAALPPVVPVSLTVQNLISRSTRYWQNPE